MTHTTANPPQTPDSASRASAFDQLLTTVSKVRTATPDAAPNFSLLQPVVGKLSGFDAAGFPLVDFTGNRSSTLIAARAVCSLKTADVDRDVVLVFEKGNPASPIILGVIQPARSSQGVAVDQQLQFELDGEEVTLTASKRLVLRCGNSSITLTSAGKVLINGAYLSSHASGVNRIKGGSVQIN